MCVPVGLSLDGRVPLSVQLVGRPGGDADLLAAAALLERAVASLSTPSGSGDGAQTGSRRRSSTSAGAHLMSPSRVSATAADGNDDVVHIAPVQPRRPRENAAAADAPPELWSWTGPHVDDVVAAARDHSPGSE